ncbi:MAG: PD-(D/E)XK nuclease family protein [Methanobrevibacter sp.]|nr:PD-(D/E)XK nuclease family protein [Methanobrevibacter sp.]
MKVSYSKVDTYNTCPFLYKLKYIEHLEPKDDLSPSNPLFIGTACHEGIETRDVEKAVESYKSHFDEITSEHEVEIEKIKSIVPKAIEQIPDCEFYEYKLDVPDEFVGYIDGLVKVDEGLYDLLDFKTSNNISGYKTSPQVHIYKYYFERLTENKVRDLYYVFIPKSAIKLNEDLSNVKEITDELKSRDIHFEKIDFDKQQVNYFFARKSLLEKETNFQKRYSSKCNWCQLRKFCKTNGADRSELK